MSDAPADHIVKLSIALVSDLHCHGKGDCNGHQESYLIASDLRNPPEKHPVEALLSLIREKDLRADVVMCPGDLAHQASTDGFAAAWLELREIARAVGAGSLLSTLGNHDVASRKAGSDPFSIAKRIHSEFPLPVAGANDQFWSQGCALHVMSDAVDVVVLNTAHDHYSETAARSGTFGDSQVHALNTLLSTTAGRALRIALLHHHPLLHSVAGFDSADVLSSGDQVLDVLAANGVSVVIHGHKHHPRLKRDLHGGNTLYVFAAGSLSAYLNQLSTRTRNVCHFVDLAIAASGHLHGRIRTWEYNYAKGWNPTSVRSAEFPHVASFGPLPAGLMDRITELFVESGVDLLYAKDLYGRVPELRHLTPDELQTLAADFASETSLQAEFAEDGTLRLVGRRAEEPPEEGIW